MLINNFIKAAELEQLVRIAENTPHLITSVQSEALLSVALKAGKTTKDVLKRWQQVQSYSTQFLSEVPTKIMRMDMEMLNPHFDRLGAIKKLKEQIPRIQNWLAQAEAVSTRYTAVFKRISAAVDRISLTN